MVGKRDVKDKAEDLTRDPEMVRAYRDTWQLGVHSYLAYLRDRLAVARELLADTGSIFVQISDENLHRVRVLIDEVFGCQNFVAQIYFQTTTGRQEANLDRVGNYLLWYARNHAAVRSRKLFLEKGTTAEDSSAGDLQSQGVRSTGSYAVLFQGRKYVPLSSNHWKVTEMGMSRLAAADRIIPMTNVVRFRRIGDDFPVQALTDVWTDLSGGAGGSKMYVVQTGTRIIERCLLMTTDPGDLVLDPTCGSGTTAYVAEQWGRRWITIDTSRVAVSIARQRLLTAKYDYYRVKTAREDLPAPLPSRQAGARAPRGASPGDGFRYKTVPHITLKSIAQNPNLDPIFARHEPILDERLAACNAALAGVSPDLRSRLKRKLLDKQKAEGKRGITDADSRRWLLPPDNRDRKKPYDTVANDFAGWYHWEVPFDTDSDWPKALQDAVTAYRKAWRAKMDEVNACIAANADQEELVDQPEVVRNVLRVSGPFTVEGVRPEELSMGDEGLFDPTPNEEADWGSAPSPAEEAGFHPAPRRGVTDSPDPSWPARSPQPSDAPWPTPSPVAMAADFAPMEREVRRACGPPAGPGAEPQNIQAYLSRMVALLKQDGVTFPNNQHRDFLRIDALYEQATGAAIHAEGIWEGGDEGGPNTVAIAFGPQYGPVTAYQVEDLMRAARLYDELVIAGFSFNAEAAEIIQEAQHPKLTVHMAHIRPDVSPGMDGLLKDTPNSQLFTVFGQPEVEVRKAGDDEFEVELIGVDIYDPLKGEVKSTGASKVAAWFLDANYDGRCFCITQAFFPKQDAWDKIAKALGSSADTEAFEAFKGTVSVPFKAGKHRRIAVKVIDPRGNEVMAVARLE